MPLIDVFIASAAGLYIWVFLSQLHTPFMGWLQSWFRRGWRVELIGCPWCTGFWLSAVLVVLLQWARLDIIVTPICILASAALIGFAGAMTPGIDIEDED